MNACLLALAVLAQTAVEKQFRAEAGALARRLEKAGANDEARFLAAWAGEKIEPAAPRIAWGRPLEETFTEFGKRFAPAFQRVDDVLAEILASFADHAHGFRVVNDRRRACGLAAVEFDPARARACQLHCRYLVRWPDDGHDETPSKTGYTKEGAQAGKSSVLSFQERLPGAVDGWIATFYHRIEIFYPALKSVGTGQAKSAHGFTTALDVWSGHEWNVPLSRETQEYPPDGSADCLLRFQPEWPDPLPEKAEAGNAVTLSFWKSVKTSQVRARLLEEGTREVSCWLSSPDRPARADFDNFGTICLIPRRILKPRTRYVAVVEAEVDGRPFRREWAFITGVRQNP